MKYDGSLAIVPQHDPRSVDELIHVLLTECDEEIVWRAVAALHWRGSQEVLKSAKDLCSSFCPLERAMGARILGQLGLPDRTFPAECAAVLQRMLRRGEQPEVLREVLVAFSHLDHPESVPLVVNFAKHSDPTVRHAVTLALSSHESPPATDCLILLTNDQDAHVRDWATFALGTILELDTPQIRDALATRLGDPDDDTRAEAMMGLARRKDDRVIEALKRELASDVVGTLTIEAAELIGSKDLHPYLVSLRQWWVVDDSDAAVLEEAIAASRW